MSALDSIEKIDAARAELARHGIALESFELMRGRITALEERLRRVLEAADEIACLASKQSSDLKPFELGSAFEKLRQAREGAA